MVKYSCIRVALASLTLVMAIALAPAVALAQAATPHVVVNTYRLNVRSGPGVSHGIITTVAGGAELAVTMLSRDGQWFEVASPAGAGWLRGSYTAFRGDISSVPRQGESMNLGGGVAIAPGTPHVVVNTAYLNIRTGPGVGNAILTTVRGGTALPVTARQFGTRWYQVESSAGKGWLNSNYTVMRGDFGGIMVEGEPAERGPQPTVPAGTPHLVVNTAYLNVRTGPGVGHGILTTVPGGTVLQVTAIDSGGVWHQVVTASGAGWVNSNYAAARGDFASLTRQEVATIPPSNLSGPTPRAVVNTYRLNVRTGPGVGYAVVAAVPGGTTLKVLGLSSSRNWYLVEGSFGQGWLNNHYVAFRGDFSQVQVVS